MVNIAILDGYVDEPAIFGVPPFISPYPRYIAGAIVKAGYKVDYYTIDQWRNKNFLMKKYDYLIAIGGAIVPGKYLRSSPASIKELQKIADEFQGTKILAGPVSSFGFNSKEAHELKNHYDFFAIGDPDAWTYDFFTNVNPSRRERTNEEWKEFPILGANIVNMHPDYPVPLIAEIEMYKGCVRYASGGCLFCSEVLYGKPRMRGIEDIQKEINALYKRGIVNFRLGGATCIFTYMAEEVNLREGNFRPNPDAINKLFKGIWKQSTGIKVLHTDNANPEVIASYPDESEKIIETLVNYTTPGNVLSFGLESADPVVKEKNNLNATPEQVLFAISLVNKHGRQTGTNGMPKLLPGINFIGGLEGETNESYSLNKKFLEEIIQRNLIVRRVNVRQVASVRHRFKKINKKRFFEFKNYVRGYFDSIMLQRMLPAGNVVKEVFIELNIGEEAYGRQIGTYPLLIKFPYKIKPSCFVNAKIYQHGSRSVHAIDTEFNLNQAPYSIIRRLPAINDRMAISIVRNRPFNDIKEISKIINDNNAVAFLSNYTTINESSWKDKIVVNV
ncbi:MAG: radical SAM protein [Thermoplasmata archaeon]